MQKAIEKVYFDQTTDNLLTNKIRQKRLAAIKARDDEWQKFYLDVVGSRIYAENSPELKEIVDFIFDYILETCIDRNSLLINVRGDLSLILFNGTGKVSFPHWPDFPKQTSVEHFERFAKEFFQKTGNEITRRDPSLLVFAQTHSLEISWNHVEPK